MSFTFDVRIVLLFSTALGSSDVVVTAVAGILLGFVVLIFCLFILFIALCRKKDEEEVKIL